MRSKVDGQNGFAAIEVILLVIVVGIIGGTGWYVYNSVHKTNNTLKSISNSSASNAIVKSTKANSGSSTSTSNSSTVSNPTAGWQTYSNSQYDFTIQYPSGWVVSTSPVISIQKQGSNLDDRDLIIGVDDYSSMPINNGLSPTNTSYKNYISHYIPGNQTAVLSTSSIQSKSGTILANLYSFSWAGVNGNDYFAFYKTNDNKLITFQFKHNLSTSDQELYNQMLETFNVSN